MSKPSVPKMLMPAIGVVAIAIASVAMIVAGASHARIRKAGAAQPVANAPALSAQQRSRIRASFDALPLAFEANQGQTDPQVKYIARGSGYTAFLTGNETVFAVSSEHASSAAGKRGVSTASYVQKTKASQPTEAAIHMKLVGGNPEPAVVAGNELPGHSNYFIGDDPSKWQQGVKHYAGVSYRDVYPGVNMKFHGEQRQLEFDFVVAAGADAGRIRFGVAGAKQIKTDNAGNLILASAAGDVMLHKPVAYQEKDNTRQSVDARFAVEANNTIAFELGNYDRSRELVIDPSVVYATYLGGSAEDDGNAIAVDSSGNAYVTGQTKSTNFPTITGAYSGTNAGGFDAFVSKISASGSSLEYSTYIGGTSDDSGNAIAVNSSGDAFVAGGTKSTNFPHTAGVFQTNLKGGLNVFVLELSSSGGTLTYSTFLGGSSSDVAFGIAVDSGSDTYIVGQASSPDFPVKNPIQGSLNGSLNGFVTKLNSSGTALVYSTYLGGSGDDAFAVAVDSSDNAYVVGETQNSTFPVTPGVVQPTCASCANATPVDDAFVSVIKPDGSGFVYSTFLGGTSADEAFGIAVDSSKNAYVTGLTSSTDFPLQSAIQSKFGGGTEDAFVTELNPTGSALVYSTYLGGTGDDSGIAIALDASANAYVTGQTSSSTKFPLVNATQPVLGGANDAFVTEISAGGSQFLFSTYIGGSLNEDTSASGNGAAIGGIAVDSAGANIYITGNTDSSGSSPFPTTSGAFQTSYGGGTDAFVAKFSTAASTANFTVTNGALSPSSGAPGVFATSTITVTSLGGFNSAVALGCSISPAVANGPACAFTNPGAAVTPPAGGTVSALLNVATTNPSASLLRRSGSEMFYAMILPVFGLTLVGAGMKSSGRRSRKILGLLMLWMILAGLLLMPACGGGSTTGGGSGGTPAGNYTITVTGTAGGATATGTPALTLTVN